jgi:subtilase family serine protease
MKLARWWILAGSAGLAALFLATAAGASVVAPAAGPYRVALPASAAPAKDLAHATGKVAATSKVSFMLSLSLRKPAGARAFSRAVSSPSSAEFHHYLTDRQWVSRFGPTTHSAARVTAWLRSKGFLITAVPKDRLFVSAEGTARQVERAFDVQLGYFRVNGHEVRLAKGTLTIPGSLAGSVSGVVGVNQYLAGTDLAPTGASARGRTAAPAQEPAPPAGFRNPQPCSGYWGQRIDTTDHGSLYSPYTSPLPYTICGYNPNQLRAGYHLNVGQWNGSGVGIAIVDAYDSPTLLSDAQLYFRLNDPAHLLSSSHFFNIQPSTVDDEAECGGSGWYAEQALDVEASHSMAPGANILFVGAQDCQDSSLLAAVNTAITSGASVVTDSWGDFAGDLFADADTHTAFDNTFLLAAGTGVSVLFSSGDDGDNFAASGLAVPDYPATSPWVTAVGGTTLEVGAQGRQAEYGWSTGKQVLCEKSVPNCGSATTPLQSAPAYQAGGGGGTSYYYTQPYYQAPIVPAALALRNKNLFGPVPLRVVPDISMDADAQSGMLIGLTQAFPDGVYYGQFKEGGTSLASPLLAGVIADADQASAVSLGFLNPVLYKAYAATPGAYNDIVPPASPRSAALIRVDYANTVDSSDGYVASLRIINYAGPETYCDGTGNCATRNVTLTTAPGFDGMTGLGSPGQNFVGTLAKY